MAWLTKGKLALTTAATALVGFLYNVQSRTYVTVDSDHKWLYATSVNITSAVRFGIYQDSIGNIVLNATIGSNSLFFNWRNLTGACKLYDSYDSMTAVNWASKKLPNLSAAVAPTARDSFVNDSSDLNAFNMLNTSNNELIGTWSTDDLQVYNRSNIADPIWAFRYFDQAAFTADDRLIFSTYLKERRGV
jgi:hypothetical protein